MAIRAVRVAAMAKGTLLPVRWAGQVAVAALPEHVDVSNSGEIREELLTLINRGADVLVADMSGTLSCDHGGADALVRAHHRASVSGTQLRLVVTAPIVRRVLDANGLDRLVSIYPSVEAAVAAGMPGSVIPLVPRPGTQVSHGRSSGPSAASSDRPGSVGQAAGGYRATITPGVLWRLVDALDDGVLLTDDDGVVALANRRLEEMFGYRHGELIGQRVEAVVPVDLRAAHERYRTRYARQPTAKLMSARGRLVGLRKDGATLPVQISLTPVPTATGRFTLAVVRDVAPPPSASDLIDLAHSAVAAHHGYRANELLDRVVNDLYKVGRSLQGAADLPHDEAKHRIAEAVRELDDTIREIRDHIFGSGGRGDPPDRG